MTFSATRRSSAADAAGVMCDATKSSRCSSKFVLTSSHQASTQQLRSGSPGSGSPPARPCQAAAAAPPAPTPGRPAPARQRQPSGAATHPPAAHTTPAAGGSAAAPARTHWRPAQARSSCSTSDDGGCSDGRGERCASARMPHPQQQRTATTCIATAKHIPPVSTQRHGALVHLTQTGVSQAYRQE